MIYDRTYKTLTSEKIAFCSAMYAVLSLIISNLVMRFLNNQEIVVAAVLFVIVSVFFSLWALRQSHRRIKLNKLPSDYIIKILYLVKKESRHGQEDYSQEWHTYQATFNTKATDAVFEEFAGLKIEPQEYFTFVLAENLITATAININNSLSIKLSKKGLERLEIFEKSEKW